MTNDLKHNDLEQEEDNTEQQSGSQQDGAKRVDPINESIETIVNLHVRMERKISRHQRTVEMVSANLGRPRFLYFILSGVTIWILVNIMLARSGVPTIDPPPFAWLQGAVGLSALLMTTVVLITQNRQNKVTEKRRQLDLQVNLLVEQKVTKVIRLIEELRRDLPSIEERHDPEVEALKDPVDPHEVLTALSEMLKESSQGQD